MVNKAEKRSYNMIECIKNLTKKEIGGDRIVLVS